MATSDQPIVYNYTGDNSTTVFPFNCYVLDASDMVVSLSGVIQTTGYTVNGVGVASGGDITFSTAPATDAPIIIYRELTYDRPTDYQPNGPFLEQTVDNDQDRQTMQIQQLAEVDERTLKLPIGTEGVSTVMPVPGADEFIKWNALGTALETSPGTDPPAPVTEDVTLFEWSQVGITTPNGNTESTISGIDPTAIEVLVKINNMSLTPANDALVARFGNANGIITDPVYVGCWRAGQVSAGTLLSADWGAVSGLLLANTYATVHFGFIAATNSYTGNIRLTKDHSSLGTWKINMSGIEFETDLDTRNPQWSDGYIEIQTGDLYSVQIRSDNNDTFDNNPTIEVWQYAETKTITTQISTPSNTAMAEYGNTGAFYTNTGTNDDLVLTLPSDSTYRTAYPSLVSGAYRDGTRAKFTVSGANAGAMTARIGSGPVVALTAGDTTPFVGGEFSADTEYEIYARDNTFRYDIPAAIAIPDNSIALIKQALGTPGAYLVYDGAGQLVETTPPAGVITGADKDATGVNYSGGGQLYTWAHGLGGVPFSFGVMAQCIVADQGYGIGRRFMVHSYCDSGSGGSAQRGFSVTADATNVYLKVGSDGFWGISASGTHQQFTVNSWKFKAWAEID